LSAGYMRGIMVTAAPSGQIGAAAFCREHVARGTRRCKQPRFYGR